MTSLIKIYPIRKSVIHHVCQIAGGFGKKKEGKGFTFLQTTHLQVRMKRKLRQDVSYTQFFPERSSSALRGTVAGTFQELNFEDPALQEQVNTMMYFVFLLSIYLIIRFRFSYFLYSQIGSSSSYSLELFPIGFNW